MSDEYTTIPEHLVRRLRELNVELGFGIVGDYALRLFSELDELGFPILVTADEQGAGFAADAFARLRGFGVVACTNTEPQTHKVHLLISFFKRQSRAVLPDLYLVSESEFNQH